MKKYQIWEKIEKLKVPNWKMDLTDVYTLLRICNCQILKNKHVSETVLSNDWFEVLQVIFDCIQMKIFTKTFCINF